MTYFDWKKVWTGVSWGFEYREGRTVARVVRDFEPGRWYWSVYWPAHNMPPKKNDDGSQWIGGGRTPRRVKWGHESTDDLAKEAAQAALLRGRESST